MADDAKIGYPPVRVWGCPQTSMWVYRLGAERAKLLLLTGDLIDGRTAAGMGLVARSVPAAELAATVEALAERMAGIPKNHLMIQKLVINQAYDNMGLQSTQTLATFLDGVTRHTPEGVQFKQRCEEVGFKAAVKERDSGQPIG
jgi:enoyl-CoA hydratase